MSCNKITNNIVHKGDEAILWKIKHINSHEGLHIAYHPNNKGSWYNVMVEWVTGKTNTYSLTVIMGGDIITCALYGDDSQEKWEWHKQGRFSFF